jgi:hypothetical protein
MPLHIGRVEAEMDIAPARDGGLAAPEGPPTQAAPAAATIESLRPMVLQILREELASFQRQQG